MADIQHFMIADGPTPVAPFSHATEAGGFVFLTGQMPTDPKDDTKPLPDGDSKHRRAGVMDNLIIILNGVGLTLSDVVQCRLYLTHFDRDYAVMNETYVSYFEAGKLPARTTIGVTGLAVGALVEIDMVAKRPN